MVDMSSVNPIVLATLIAGVAALVSALVTSLITLRISNKLTMTDYDKTTIEYLNRKISLLETNKKALCEERQSTVSGGFQKEQFAAAGADAVDGTYKLASSILVNVDHYLPTDIASTLQDQKELIDHSLAYGKAKVHSLIEDESGWEGNTDNLIKEGDNIITAMIDFYWKVKTTIDKELSLSVQKVEKMIRLE